MEKEVRKYRYYFDNDSIEVELLGNKKRLTSHSLKISMEIPAHWEHNASHGLLTLRDPELDVDSRSLVCLLYTSNESEIVYLDARKLDSPFFDAFLIHEYTHLIFLNQKIASDAFKEEHTWLVELYSEYAATAVQDKNVFGYFDQRIREFFKNPSISLVEWNGNVYNYAIITCLLYTSRCV